MARHTYLTESDIAEGLLLLKPPIAAPTGKVSEELHWKTNEISQWLEKKLFAKLEFNQVKPLFLGSWARAELCPKSDLDLLLLGDEKEIENFSQKIYELGIPLRYRTPLNMNDWTEGVDAFDILNLLQAKTKSQEISQLLLEQKQNIKSSKVFRKMILKAIVKDREQRRQRHDSISSFLEPHLKHGPGGLRDLMQGLAVIDLFPEKFEQDEHARNVLKYYRDFFLSLRQKLHLTGFGDQLIASEQSSLASWLGYKDSREFMKQIQKGLSRVLFYSDWVLETALSSKLKLSKYDKLKFKDHKAMAMALKKDSSKLMQYQVRLKMDQTKACSGLDKGKVLKQILSASGSEQWMDAFFASRLVDKFIPRFVPLVGYVQHDQYHRFSADAHLQQVCREVKRVYKNPKRVMKLADLVKAMSAKDWQILSWVALYHDLAKGQGGDHDDVGAQYVKEDFKKFGIESKEVQWLVKNHLELSKAAFKKDPNQFQTWQDLWQKDLNVDRLRRLAVFTAIDILGTNPEALNQWKTQLLKDLVTNLESQSTQNLLSLQKEFKKKFKASTLESLHPLLLERLPLKTLKTDLAERKNPIEVYQSKTKEIWVRFYQKQDEAGLLYKYVQQLHSNGCGIRHALVHTLPEVGVYDWFHVSTNKTAAELKRRLAIGQASLSKTPPVKFTKISIVSETAKEWIISFRGLDQKGMLLAACEKLYELGAEISSARVHTWGREIDDLFTIKAMQNKTEVLESLRKDLT